MADNLVGYPDIGTDVLSTGNDLTQGLRTPIRGFRFTADFGPDLGTTSFKSVDGFSSDVDVSEYREGGFGTLTKRKVPGLLNFGEIKLEKGLYVNATLYNFYNDFLEGKNFDPVKEATIICYDNAMQEQARWVAINVWPKSYESSGLSAEDSAILIESLTLVHEGIKRVNIT